MSFSYILLVYFSQWKVSFHKKCGERPLHQVYSKLLCNTCVFIIKIMLFYSGLHYSTYLYYLLFYVEKSDELSSPIVVLCLFALARISGLGIGYHWNYVLSSLTLVLCLKALGKNKGLPDLSWGQTSLTGPKNTLKLKILLTKLKQHF